MTTDTETTSTGNETPSEDGQVAPEVQEPPAAEPVAEAAATEPAPETQPSAEEEEDARVKAAVDATLGKAPSEPEEGDKITLSKAEIEERERRAAQSAADSARAEAQRESQRLQEQAAARGRIRADMRRDIETHIKKAAESGEASDAVIDEINRRYGGALFEEATEFVTTNTDNEATQALAAVQGVLDAAPEDLAPLGKPFSRPADKFAAMFEVVAAVTRKQVKAEMADWVEKEVARKVRPATEASVKKILADIRGAQKGGELPKGEAVGEGPTDEEIAKHRGDLVWWNANKEAYYRRIGAAKK